MINSKQFVLDALAEFGRAKALEFRHKVITEELSDTDIIENETWIPEWKPQNYDAGIPVRYEEQIYTVSKTHDSTDNPELNPMAAVDLFDIKHTTNPKRAKPFVKRKPYKASEVCARKDKVWYCVQENTTVDPAELPQAWQCIGDEEFSV